MKPSTLVLWQLSKNYCSGTHICVMSYLSGAPLSTLVPPPHVSGRVHMWLKFKLWYSFPSFEVYIMLSKDWVVKVLQVGVLTYSCLLLEVPNPLFGHMMGDIWEMTDIKEKLKKRTCGPSPERTTDGVCQKSSYLKVFEASLKKKMTSLWCIREKWIFLVR